MLFNYYINKDIGGAILVYLKENEENLEIKLKCDKCKDITDIKIKNNRVKRYKCKQCNHRKVLVYVKNGKYCDIKMITEYAYNKISREYSEKDIKEEKFKFLVMDIFNVNLMETSEIIEKDIDIKENNKSNLISIAVSKKKNQEDKSNDTKDLVEEKVDIMERLKDKNKVSLLAWAKRNGELGDLVIKLYSKRKNEIKISDIPIDSEEIIWFNRGELKGLFSNTALDIVTNNRIRKKLPNRYSYNKLFIYNYFDLIYDTKLNSSIGNVEVDILIEELNLAIVYVGTTYKYSKDIDKIIKELSRKEIRLIVIEGVHQKDNINIIDNTITFNGSSRVKDIEYKLYEIATIILKEYDMRISIRPDIEDIKNRIGLIY